MVSLSPLRATALYYAYDRTPVLSDVSLELPAGRVTAIAGPNGAGKSTLIELLAGVRLPDEGRVERDAAVALVVQRPLAPAELPLTAGAVVALGAAAPAGRSARRRAGDRAGARLFGRAERVGRVGLAERVGRAERVTDALTRVGAFDLVDRPFAELSGGQRQRVLIAQGLAVGAGILLLDEPAAGLDADSRARTRALLAAEASRGVAVACVTHDPDDLAAADSVVRLAGGLAHEKVRVTLPQQSPVFGSELGGK
ncbi:metal ABC transporter ATP-binding protein [Leucobacter albus]|uniref:Metal ABC transporter ATP-binding protein n=1 Tax=Leucobacter albus TaxID=272210 RepID=A0ABW3TII8_9MICO